MRKRTLGLLTVLVVGVTFCCSSAFGYSSVVAFGDSLTDNGSNAGKYTDGPMWVESLASHLSATLYDRAYSGANTDTTNYWYWGTYPFSGLLSQVDNAQSLIGSLPSSNTLITVWAGANDLQWAMPAQQSVDNIETALEGLYAEGGRDFLVPNLPDVGKTPSFYYDLDPNALVSSQQASDWTLTFNLGLADMLQNLQNQHPDITLFTVDIFSAFNQFQVGSQDWLNLFWTDGFHPNKTGHELIYEAAAKAIGDPAPEPSTFALFAAGIAEAILVIRKKRLPRKRYLC